MSDIESGFSLKNSIRQRRCIIPLEGFYDFQGRGKKNGKEDNQCYYIDFKDGQLLYTAGIRDVCCGPLVKCRLPYNSPR